MMGIELARPRPSCPRPRACADELLAAKAKAMFGRLPHLHLKFVSSHMVTNFLERLVGHVVGIGIVHMWFMLLVLGDSRCPRVKFKFFLHT